MRNVALSAVLGAALAIGAMALAQTQTTQNQQTQTSQTSQTGKSGNGQAWGTASSQASASGSASASRSGSAQAVGSRNASGFQQGSSRGFASGRDATHAIMFDSNRHGDSATDKMIQERRAYYENFARNGKVVASGPWFEKNGGLTLLIVKTDQEAAQIAAGDPAVKAGLWNYRVRRWSVDVVSAPMPPIPPQTATMPAAQSRAGSPPPR